MDHGGKRKRRRSGKGKNIEQNQATTSSSTIEEQNSIPGFYFDSERRRYFRILPDHQGVGLENCITPDTLKRKNLEMERQNLLKNSHQDFSTNDRSMTSIIRKREMGLINRGEINRRIMECRMKSCGRIGDIIKPGVFQNLLPYRREPGHVDLSYLSALTNGRFIFGHWTADTMPSSVISSYSVIVQVKPDSTRQEEGSHGLVFELEYQVREAINIKRFTDIRFTINNQRVYVLMSSILENRNGNNGNVTLDSYPLTADGIHPFDFETAITNSPNGWAFKSIVWSCACNPLRRLVAAGLERWSEIIDVETHLKSRLNTKKKTSLVQEFSQDGNTLFMGLRAANAIAYDLRTGEIGLKLEQKCVSSLHVMDRDDNYIVAGDYFGKIKLWDLRMQKSVRTYDGQMNTHTKLPLIVNEEDSLVIAGGEDGTTRCWSLQSGELLRQIASPYPVIDQVLPGVCYSNCWGGIPGNAAIVLGVRDELHYYSLKC